MGVESGGGILIGDEQVSRRGFLSEALKFLAREAGGLLAEQVAPRRHFRPPGALPEPAFLAGPPPELPQLPVRQFFPGVVFRVAQKFVDDRGHTRNPGEVFTLPLGLDRAIKPVRNVKLVQAEKGVFSKDDVGDYTVSIEVANPSKTPLPLRIVDQYPVTDDKNVEIKLGAIDARGERSVAKDTVLKELGVKTVPVVYVTIPDKDKEQELIIRLNKNTGEFDLELLAQFDESLLADIGFGFLLAGGAKFS